MLVKNIDQQGRWRNKTVAFRVSPEDELIETAVSLSGLTKQDYIIRRLTCREITVQGNPRVYKVLKNKLDEVLAHLQGLGTGETPDKDLLDTIQMITEVMKGLKEDNEWQK